MNIHLQMMMTVCVLFGNSSERFDVLNLANRFRTVHISIDHLSSRRQRMRGPDVASRRCVRPLPARAGAVSRALSPCGGSQAMA